MSKSGEKTMKNLRIQESTNFHSKHKSGDFKDFIKKSQASKYKSI